MTTTSHTTRRCNTTTSICGPNPPAPTHHPRMRAERPTCFRRPRHPCLGLHLSDSCGNRTLAPASIRARASLVLYRRRSSGLSRRCGRPRCGAPLSRGSPPCSLSVVRHLAAACFLRFSCLACAPPTPSLVPLRGPVCVLLARRKARALAPAPRWLSPPVAGIPCRGPCPRHGAAGPLAWLRPGPGSVLGLALAAALLADAASCRSAAGSPAPRPGYAAGTRLACSLQAAHRPAMLRGADRNAERPA